MNSYIWIAKKIADQMIKYKIKNGSIVLLSSIYGILGQDLELYKNTKMAESMSYSAIKGGINNCVRSMASYYGSRNIRVNSIIAGGVLDKQNKIKTTGEYSVDIDLHPEVNCSLDIEILSPKTSA